MNRGTGGLNLPNPPSIRTLLSNQPMYVYNNLQSVLRTAACLVMKLPGYASITEVMKKDLHWLGFPQRISYKLYTLTYKCLHGMAPEYLTRRFTLIFFLQ